MKPGDVAIIFTPDDTHFGIASAAINAGLHVLVAKPIVKTLEEHRQLVALAKRQNVLVRWPAWLSCGGTCGFRESVHAGMPPAAAACCVPALPPTPANKTQRHHTCDAQLAVEYHKRFDPIYSDARNRCVVVCGAWLGGGMGALVRSNFGALLTDPEGQGGGHGLA